jgi:putative membrane protein
MEPHEPKKLAIWKVVLLFSLNGFFCWMLVSGYIMRYISPRLLPFMYFANFALLILAFIQLKRNMDEQKEEETCACCTHSHHTFPSRWKGIVTYGLLALPIILGIVVPYEVPGSALAAKKGIQTSITPSAQKITASPSSQAEEQDGDDYFRKEALELKKHDKLVVTDENYFATLTALDMYLPEFIGKKIQIQGMIYVDPDNPHSGDSLGKVLIACCFADATFYGLPIKNESNQSYKQDTWVSIEGIIGETKENGITVACIRAKKIRKIPAPKTPYIYTNF